MSRTAEELAEVAGRPLPPWIVRLCPACDGITIPPEPPTPPPAPVLTARELDVLRLAAAGLGNTQIGRRLFIGENTVKTHMASVCRTLHAANRTHAVALGYARGILTAADAHNTTTTRGTRA